MTRWEFSALMIDDEDLYVCSLISLVVWFASRVDKRDKREEGYYSKSLNHYLCLS